MNEMSLTPFEELLERLAAATVAGDADLADELRAAIEADLAAREGAHGL